MCRTSSPADHIPNGFQKQPFLCFLRLPGTTQRRSPFATLFTRIFQQLTYQFVRYVISGFALPMGPPTKRWLLRAPLGDDENGVFLAGRMSLGVFTLVEPWNKVSWVWSTLIHSQGDNWGLMAWVYNRRD
jgi:hypothetical protein